MLEEKKYSNDAVLHLIAILIGWLTGHVLIEDRAITGKTISRWNHQRYKGDVVDQIDSEFRLFAEDLFSMKVRLVNRHYTGEYLGNSVYKYYNTFTGPLHSYKTIFFSSEEFIKYGVDKLTNHIKKHTC